MQTKPQVGKHYMDNEENVYKCIATMTKGPYSEAVMQLTGRLESQAAFYFVFYCSQYAWLDRENPDFKLLEEVEIFPSLVELPQ